MDKFRLLSFAHVAYYKDFNFAQFNRVLDLYVECSNCARILERVNGLSLQIVNPWALSTVLGYCSFIKCRIVAFVREAKYSVLSYYLIGLYGIHVCVVYTKQSGWCFSC